MTLSQRKTVFLQPRTVSMTSPLFSCVFFPLSTNNCILSDKVFFCFVGVLDHISLSACAEIQNFYSKNKYLKYFLFVKLTWILSFFLVSSHLRLRTFSTVINATIEVHHQPIQQQDYWGIFHVYPTIASATITFFCSTIWDGNDNKWSVVQAKYIWWEKLWI